MSTESEAREVSRRQWVRDTALAGMAATAAVGVAACATSGADSASPTPRAHGSAPGATQGAAPGAGSGAATGPEPRDTTTRTRDTALPETPNPFNPSLVVAKVSTIPVGGGVVYPKHGVVVTQPTAGDYKCFNSSCTHLGCTVNKVTSGLILCPCHGAKFSIVDGSVKAGPAPRPLTVEGFSILNNEIVLD